MNPFQNYFIESSYPCQEPQYPLVGLDKNFLLVNISLLSQMAAREEKMTAEVKTLREKISELEESMKKNVRSII